MVVSTRFLLRDLDTKATTSLRTPLSLKALFIAFRTTIAKKGRSLAGFRLIKISLLAFKLVDSLLAFGSFGLAFKTRV